MRIAILFCFATMLAMSAPALAIFITPGAVYGVMQQPTSQYYHTVNGAYLDLRSDKASAIFRLAYIERPEFVSAGYTDQESGVFASIGTTVNDYRPWRLSAYIGTGQMTGSIAATDAASTQASRSFQLTGLSLELDWALIIAKRLEIGVNHLTHIGWIDQAQLSAYVAWPYNFFMLRIGVAI